MHANNLNIQIKLFHDLFQGTLYTPLDLAAYKNHTLIVDYLNQRHRAKRADQIPEEQRIDSTTQLEESMQKGFIMMLMEIH